MDLLLLYSVEPKLRILHAKVPTKLFPKGSIHAQHISPALTLTWIATMAVSNCKVSGRKASPLRPFSISIWFAPHSLEAAWSHFQWSSQWLGVRWSQEHNASFGGNAGFALDFGMVPKQPKPINWGLQSNAPKHKKPFVGAVWRKNNVLAHDNLWRCNWWEISKKGALSKHTETMMLDLDRWRTACKRECARSSGLNWPWFQKEDFLTFI